MTAGSTSRNLRSRSPSHGILSAPWPLLSGDFSFCRFLHPLTKWFGLEFWYFWRTAASNSETLAIFRPKALSLSFSNLRCHYQAENINWSTAQRNSPWSRVGARILGLLHNDLLLARLCLAGLWTKNLLFLKRGFFLLQLWASPSNLIYWVLILTPRTQHRVFLFQHGRSAK